MASQSPRANTIDNHGNEGSYYRMVNPLLWGRAHRHNKFGANKSCKRIVEPIRVAREILSHSHTRACNLKGSPNNQSSYCSHWGVVSKATKGVVMICEINLVDS